jgi:hypothetical protein
VFEISESVPQVMASRGTKRRTTVRLALGRSADKPARYPKECAGIGVGGPIIAIEAGQRTLSIGAGTTYGAALTFATLRHAATDSSWNHRLSRRDSARRIGTTSDAKIREASFSGAIGRHASAPGPLSD